MDQQGSEILTFAEWIREIGGSGGVYTEEIEEILKSWQAKDWVFTDEYIAPIAHTLLVDAAEVHPKLYAKLMKVIVEAFDELKEGLGPEPETPHLTRIK